ncbi:MAG: DUF2333 family protein [Desulfobacterales bacterium]|nr:DUF2333 family protein [Desulfobacterales bacterium]
MAEPSKNNGASPGRKGFTAFFLKRAIFAVVIIAAFLYALSLGIEQLGKWQDWKQRDSATEPAALALKPAQEPAPAVPATLPPPPPPPGSAAPSPSHAGESNPVPDITVERPADAHALTKAPAEDSRPMAPAEPPKAQASAAQATAAPIAIAPPAPEVKKQEDTHAPKSTQPEEKRPLGVAFVDAVIAPLDYELNQRFYGWRPNDIINVTDNVNQFQLGVLEVTRRTVVQLAERISRTGYNDAFDRNLENAMNFLMIKADSYWFPSPESKYKESLAELELYKKKLLADKASFHIRTDNIIPLLSAYEDLLGSCDENLVKLKEPDGSKVGYFKADNYFYYAKGVASAMATILEAAQRDFAVTLENRRAAELMHHAITYCRMAASMEPWIVTNGSLDGILANHRAHLAAPMSHARYYMGQLIKTLST